MCDFFVLKHVLSGNLWDLTFLDGEKARIFVPKSQPSHPQKFKYFFDTQRVQIRFNNLDLSRICNNRVYQALIFT